MNTDSNFNTQEANQKEKKLAVIQLGRLATWLFIMGSFFYLYAFEEE